MLAVCAISIFLPFILNALIQMAVQTAESGIMRRQACLVFPDGTQPLAFAPTTHARYGAPTFRSRMEDAKKT